MPAHTRDLLCRYHYDPLDRLVGTTPTDDDGLQRFYCKSRLATEIQGAAQRSIFQHGEQLLAQQDQNVKLVEASLLATDQMRSVLQVFKTNRSSPIAYSPYGQRSIGNGLLSLLGFNGERSDPITGHYLLGNGYRAFNPVFMRFNSPDNLSPFGMGGLNAYVYCLGDPINRSDKSGHVSLWNGLLAGLNLINKRVSKFVGASTASKTKSFNLAQPTQTAQTTRLYARVLGTDVPDSVILAQYKRAKDKGLRLAVPPMKIKSPKQLKSLPYEITGIDIFGRGTEKNRLFGSGEIKFVYTERQELFVASSGHMALSVVAKSNRVISAGGIKRVEQNKFAIDNSSGHFKPEYEALYPVERFLKGLGAKVEMVRHEH